MVSLQILYAFLLSPASSVSLVRSLSPTHLMDFDLILLIILGGVNTLSLLDMQLKD